MLSLVFTLDYEIHGNGEGCPHALMVEPTARLLRLCDEHGARVTVMADVAEIMKFVEYRRRHGVDRCHGEAILDQLRLAVATGHDVQLHIHPSYFNATYDGSRWQQDWSEYDFAGLPPERMSWMIGACKAFLEDELSPARPGYRCTAFRAANWSMSPSSNVVRALTRHGISVDSSVFKYGTRDGRVRFDYTQAHSALRPWRVQEDDICRADSAGALCEVPIYSERRWLGAFVTRSRLQRAWTGSRHPLGAGDATGMAPAKPSPVARGWHLLGTAFRRHAWKADFNQCSGRQLIGALRRAAERYDTPGAGTLPFVLIGHSKLFDRRNEATLRPLLAYAASRPAQFSFATLGGLDGLAALPPVSSRLPGRAFVPHFEPA